MEKFPKHSSPGTKHKKLQAEGRPEIGVMDQSTPEALQCYFSEPDAIICPLGSRSISSLNPECVKKLGKVGLQRTSGIPVMSEAQSR